MGKKDKHVRVDDPPEYGNQWVFVAMDADTKLVPSFVVGKRTKETTYAFLLDLQKRLVDARFQLTTDGFHFYERAVEDTFAGAAAEELPLWRDFEQDAATVGAGSCTAYRGSAIEVTIGVEYQVAIRISAIAAAGEVMQ